MGMIYKDFWMPTPNILRKPEILQVVRLDFFLSLIQFVSIACLPIKIKRNESNPPSKKSPKLPLNWPINFLILAISVGLHDYMELFVTGTEMMRSNSPCVVLLSYCGLVYLVVDIIFGACNTIVHFILKVDLEQPSDEPYLATSLQDFWGRSPILTQIYPIPQIMHPGMIEPRWPRWPEWAPLPATLATFVVSGLMHELIFYRLTRTSPSWEVTCFFVLQGLCVVVEFAVLTVGFAFVTANWLFFPPLVRTGADERAIAECKKLLKFMKLAGAKKINKLV
ncbi:hypothetical protein Tsubulata_024565, partial [Turnera subulata]